MLLPTSLSPSPSVSLLPYPPMSPSPSVYLPTSPYVSLSFFLSPPPCSLHSFLTLCQPPSLPFVSLPPPISSSFPYVSSVSHLTLSPCHPSSFPLFLPHSLSFCLFPSPLFIPPLCLPPSPLSSPLPLCLSCFQSPPFQSPPPFLPLSTLFPPIPYLHDVSHTPLCLTAYLLPPLPPLFLHPFPYVFIPSCLYPSHLPPPLHSFLPLL